MLKKIEKASAERKGFTLVELVVVLVILAILAALLMPSLTGYIDKAKDKRVVAEIHQVVTAAQSLADEAYALATEELSEGTYATVTIEDVKELSEIKGTITEIIVEVESGKVVSVTMELGGIIGYYTETDGIGSDLGGFESTWKEDSNTDYYKTPKSS